MPTVTCTACGEKDVPRLEVCGGPEEKCPQKGANLCKSCLSWENADEDDGGKPFYFGGVSERYCSKECAARDATWINKQPDLKGKLHTFVPRLVPAATD